jgi:hypothetical protein
MAAEHASSISSGRTPDLLHTVAIRILEGISFFHEPSRDFEDDIMGGASEFQIEASAKVAEANLEKIKAAVDAAKALGKTLYKHPGTRAALDMYRDLNKEYMEGVEAARAWGEKQWNRETFDVFLPPEERPKRVKMVVTRDGQRFKVRVAQKE